MSKLQKPEGLTSIPEEYSDFCLPDPWNLVDVFDACYLELYSLDLHICFG